MAVPYNKLKGHSTEKIFDGAKHALAICQVPNMGPTNLTTTLYHGTFVPAFKARLGIKDNKSMPSRSTLETVYRSHLAQQNEEKTKAETYSNKKDMSDSDSSDSDENDNDKSDGFVGSDCDDDAAAATTKVTAVVPRAPFRRLRNVTKSPDELSTERMAPVRAAISKAISALQKASGVGKPTRRALSLLGFSGDGLLSCDHSSLDDKPYALRWAALVLPPEHGLPLQQMSDGNAVWCAVLQYHEGLGNGALEKLIAATRERCADLKSERCAIGGRSCQELGLGNLASVVAGKKRKQKK